jgi:hypothetical protein
MTDKRFLEKVAEEILERGSEELLRTVIVFPNRRPRIFLKKYLKEKAGKSTWLPEMLSIDEFMASLSDLVVQDPFHTWFELYDIHKEVEGDDHRDPADFLNWAPIMLNDFNDADQALADIDKLFTHLSDIKKIEHWKPGGEPLTEFEKKYLRFYEKLKDYHAGLKERLAKKSLCTKGMMYRGVAESIGERKQFPWEHFVFAGFNALTHAEKKIIKELYDRGNTLLLWDIDSYYYPSRKSGDHKTEEAGAFLTENMRYLKIGEPLWVEDSLTTSSKKIEFISVPKKIAQVKLAGQFVKKWLNENSEIKPENSAIVLADESLLLPLLTSLPTEGNYNITMGYPLRFSPVYKALDLWLEILTLQEQSRHRRFHVKLLLSLLYNPVVRMSLADPKEVTDGIKTSRNLYVDRKFVEEHFGKKNKRMFDVLFGSEPEVTKVLESFLDFCLYLGVLLDDKEQVLGQDAFARQYPMLRQQLSALMSVLKKLFVVVENNRSVISLKILQGIVSRMVGKTEINLRGEPLNGIQIMGMLETRLLDFDRVLMLSANEGNIPKTGFSDSFIPLDVKRAYGLSLPKHKTDIYAYHFFRLLQRTREAGYIYDSEPGSMGSSEKSRFLYQLELELSKVNKNLTIEHYFFKVDGLPQPDQNIVTVQKDDQVMKKIERAFEKGLSASSLNRYIECPLKFYFSNVAGIKIPDELKTTIEADVFGSIVHYILEKMYKPFEGKQIDIKKLADELKNVETYFDEALGVLYSAADVNSGKNLLLAGVIKKFVRNFVKYDIGSLEKEPRVLVGVEKSVGTELHIDNIPKVKITGFIDRIDKTTDGNEIRIIDYKTGSVDDLKIKEWDNLIKDKKLAKAFQTVLYGWLYRRSEFSTSSLKMGLFSLRKISKGFIEPEFPQDELTDFTNIFEEMLKKLVAEIYDREKFFQQTDDTKSCKYCDFKNICGR